MRLGRLIPGSVLGAAGLWSGAGLVLTTTGAMLRLLVLGFVLDGGELADALFLTATLPAVASLVRMGLDRSGPRYIGHQLGLGDRGATSVGFRTTVIMASVLGCAGAVLIVLPWSASVVVEPFLSTELWLVDRLFLGLWFAAEVARRPVAESARVLTRFGLALLADSGPRSFLFSLLLVAVHATGRASLSLTIALAAVATVVVAVGAGQTLQRVLAHGRSVLNSAPTAPFRELLALSPIMLVLLVGAMLQATGDLWVVSRFLGDGDRAVYLFAFQIATTLAVVMQVENLATQPFIARWARLDGMKDEVSAIARVAATGGLAIVTVALTAAAGVVLFLPRVLGGFDVRDIALVALLLAIGQLVNVSCGPCGTLFIMSERPRVAALVAIIVGVCAIVLEAWAASSGRLLAVAAISGGAVAAQNLTLALLARRLLDVNTVACFRPATLRQMFALARRAAG